MLSGHNVPERGATLHYVKSHSFADYVKSALTRER